MLREVKNAHIGRQPSLIERWSFDQRCDLPELV
jgi:hypothetical protein